MAKKKTTIIPVGPYHPLQEEPEFFKLYTEGEQVVGLDIELGYNHRGIEKLSEAKDYEETIFLVERVCGICSTSHPMACVQAVEEAGEIEVPERALYIRSLIGELERIHSHLLWLGLAGHFLGFNTVWMWAWRYREEVLNLCERVTGNRNHYGMLKPGGVRRDVPVSELSGIRDMLDTLDKPLNLFINTVSEDPLIQARTKGIGILTADQIRKFGALGPTARASGVDLDVRRDHPHAAYDLVEWQVVLESAGDIFAKIIVRIREMFESVRIIRQCLSRLESVAGAIDANPKEVKAGEGIGHYEAPRGEVFHYIRSDGSNRPVRHKIRAPSYMNVPTNQEAVVGETIADATIILAAVDPCYCCTERMAAVVDRESDEVVIAGHELVRLARQKTDRLRSELGYQGPELKWDM